MTSNVPPAFIFYFGAGLAWLLPARARAWGLPAVALFALAVMGGYVGDQGWVVRALGVELDLLRADRLSVLFGYVFSLTAFAGLVYAMRLDDRLQQSSIMVYVGSALGVVFSRDLVALYLFWELMAVSSAFLVLRGGRARSVAAGLRYVLVHIFGGLLLLAGIVLHVHSTGSTEFSPLSMGTAATWLMLAGVAVNAAVVPFSAWLSDAYPESSPIGGVFLCAFTTKTAVYALIRVFPGWDILVVLGCIMAIYGIVYAVLENDLRRILAYTIINQVGFKVAAVGVGTELALAGASANAFGGVLYVCLLWMVAGAVVRSTGESRLSRLGGLWRSMPWTAAMCVLGALCVAGVPGTAGFATKSLILQSMAEAHMAWAWLVLEVASAGALLHAGLRVPWLTFFSGSRTGLSGADPSLCGRLGMVLLALAVISLGVYPQALYSMLPFGLEEGYTVYKPVKLTVSLQLLSFALATFVAMRRLLLPREGQTLDTDWFYRKGAALFYRMADRGLNTLNDVCGSSLKVVTVSLVRLVADMPVRLAQTAASPLLVFLPDREHGRERVRLVVEKGTLPVGASLALAVILLCVVVFLTSS